jgi:hypothetical protein
MTLAVTSTLAVAGHFDYGVVVMAAGKAHGNVWVSGGVS